MRTILIILSFLAVTSVIAQKTSRLTVEITDIKIFNHKLYIAVYNNEKNFSKNINAVDSVITTPKDSILVVTFKALPDGEYAIAFFQDLNDNGKLDTGLLGIPTEPIGISNYDHKAKTPPTFKKAMFIVNKNMEIKIPLVTPPKDIKRD